MDIDKRFGWWVGAYDLVLWIFTIVFDLFFREITPRGAYRIPKNGPIIFVGAPHANQFVDPMILMQLVKQEAGRRVSFLVAEKSTKRKFINLFSKATSAISVARAQDRLKTATGKIQIDPNNNCRILGKGTKFKSECMERGLIGLPKSAGNGEIVEIISDTELIIRKEIKADRGKKMLNEGTEYKVADHVNQSEMYKRVFHHLHEGGCLGIFPEGGSHDRTELLPLKAGVAIMALGALAEDPNCNLKIVPCGMNYFHAHKFRSRAVIEFGTPLEITPDLIEKYKKGDDNKREAVKETLDLISQGLKSVTVQCPDYNTLMTIQAARRLYRPAGKRLPLSVVVELNRRLMLGYDRYKDDPAIIHLKSAVADYNKELKSLGIKDHQVENVSMPVHIVIGKLFYRSVKLLMLFLASMPGLVLFAPVFVLTKTISKKKAKEALAGSTVKIAGRDVLATWKLLVALAAAPVMYTFYALLAAFISWRHDLVPVPSLKNYILVIIASYIVLPTITYAALVIGDTGMDIFKSLKPLLLSLDPKHKNTVEKLRNKRRQLVGEITELVNSLGPELFPDFNKYALRSTEIDESKEDDLTEQAKAATRRRRQQYQRRDSEASSQTSESNAMSRVGSETELANMPLFSTDLDNNSDLSSSGELQQQKTPEPVLITPAASTTTQQRAFQSEVSRRIMESRSKREQENNNNDDEQ